MHQVDQFTQHKFSYQQHSRQVQKQWGCPTHHFPHALDPRILYEKADSPFDVQRTILCTTPCEGFVTEVQVTFLHRYSLPSKQLSKESTSGTSITQLNWSPPVAATAVASSPHATTRLSQGMCMAAAWQLRLRHCCCRWLLAHCRS